MLDGERKLRERAWNECAFNLTGREKGCGLGDCLIYLSGELKVEKRIWFYFLFFSFFFFFL